MVTKVYKPINKVYTINNIKFNYDSDSIYISSNDETTLQRELKRNNSIKPVFLNKTDFIMFTDNYQQPLYFKFNTDMKYEVNKLRVIDNNADNPYVTNMELLINYCDRYPIYELVTEIYNDDPAECSEEDSKQLSIAFIPEKSQIANEVLDYNDCNQMTSHVFRIIFDIENLDNYELLWLMGDHYE